MRALLPERMIAAAEHRARSIGTGADRVLICADAITEEAYLTALAESLGTAYEPLDQVSRADCPLNDHELIQAAAAGLLPLRDRGGIAWIVAPRRLTARHLADPRRGPPEWLGSFRLTSSHRLWRFVAQHAHHTLARQATEELHRRNPLLSNAPRRRTRSGLAAAAALLLGIILGLAIAPIVVIRAVGTLLCGIFLAAAGLRLSSALYTRPAGQRPIRITDDKLPTYTIICALYREAKVVGNLVGAIRALDYPIEKLDVKFVLETDDTETRRTLDRLDLGPPFDIILVPSVGPRTKPKALNVALQLAHGSYTVVYDAEDVPEPDQLRRAAAAFMHGGERLGCLQASLTIDNTKDNWLSRIFTASYAGQFDVFLPGLAALRLPFPLGGSSNHFRTSVLREVGGWDPYNVTEDADLGIRLSRFGYRTASLPSATYEEAPWRFVPWLRQRTRWYKGWIQTWLVHMRRPGRLVHDLRPTGAIAFQLFLACNVLSALIHPFFTIGLCYVLLAQAPVKAIGGMGQTAAIFGATLVAGYVSTIALDFVGLWRRRLLAHAWVLVLTPLYWWLLSLAAWRALLQLVVDPQRWEKTEHGVARSSRLAEAERRLEKRNSVALIAPPPGPRRIMTATSGRPFDWERIAQPLLR